mmetsp:Transcript_109264/g.315770  ORF Transcript_109264/g.315770 Transcript_109264/m.315770 type:complete len:231 (-) Transcript_109264:46-738(-)
MRSFVHKRSFLATGLLLLASNPTTIVGGFSLSSSPCYGGVTRQLPTLDNHANAAQGRRNIRPSTQLSMWSQDEEITGPDRFKACVPYILPLLDGEMFGKYIYERVPPLGFLDSLFVGPLYDFYSQVPLLGLIIFLVLTLGTRGNTDMNRGVRFNAQQAALIDVVLVFPELIGSAFEGEDIPRYIVEPCMNFVWYTYMAMVLYAVYENLRGKKPDQIPWISGYAEMMVGPF